MALFLKRGIEGKSIFKSIILIPGVLTTLLLASKAETVEEQTQAGQLALLAIAKLTETEASKSDSEITAVSFFGALSAVAKAQDPNLQCLKGQLCLGQKFISS